MKRLLNLALLIALSATLTSLKAEALTSTSRPEVQALRQQIEQWKTEKAGLSDQLMALRAQKHVDGLTKRLAELPAKIQAAQAASKTAQAANLTARQATLQKELALQQDLLSLSAQMREAHAASQSATAQSLREKIKADHASLKALAPQQNAGGAAHAPGPKPAEDPQVQALLEKIHALEGQIKQAQDKIKALKA